MGRGCLTILAVFAVAFVGGNILAWIWLDAAPARSNMEGTGAIQDLFFTGPALGLAFGGGAALISGMLAIRRGEFVGAGVGAAIVLFIAAFLFGYYGIYSVHEFLILFGAVPAPADPFLVSRRIAPLAALALAIVAAAWGYRRTDADKPPASGVTEE
jgi:hypothetical protein